MTNEIVFKYTSSCRGRWGELLTTCVTVLADFSDMTKWPYQIRVEETTEDSLDDAEDGESVAYHKISKGLFDSIKSTIARHTELIDLPKDIQYVSVMDGASECLTFVCPAFKKEIGGSSLLSIGYDELEEDPRSQHHCAVLYRVYQEIRELVNAERPNIL